MYDIAQIILHHKATQYVIRTQSVYLLSVVCVAAVYRPAMVRTSLPLDHPEDIHWVIIYIVQKRLTVSLDYRSCKIEADSIFAACDIFTCSHLFSEILNAILCHKF